MKAYREYAQQLDELLTGIDWGRKITGYESRLANALNGEAKQELFERIRRRQIENSGAFFTDHKLADRLVAKVPPGPQSVSDPTCGAGDLLLAWAKRLPVESDLRHTVKNWGKMLHGLEIHSEFIAVARRRLVLKAIARGAKLTDRASPLDCDRLFTGICQGNALGKHQEDVSVTTELLNPPFNAIIAPKRCTWAQGRVSLAALLFARRMERGAPNTRLIAILPEVLRTGSRYGRWRQLVENQLDHLKVEPIGRFDGIADVDVFILDGIIRPGPKSSRAKFYWWRGDRQAVKIGAQFTIHVGSVVPHRHPMVGPWRLYASTAQIAGWKEITLSGTKRRFDGTVVQAPFVTVRRTSSPSDRVRGIASIIKGRELVAVENHLLIARPVSGGLQECRALVRSLKDPRTTRWLNRRIRCRHLTVEVLKEMPIWPVT